MPYLAIHEGSEETPVQVPKGVNVDCPECGERMRVWSRSSDGRSRHFKHVEGMGYGEGGGSGSCDSVAESDKHKVWKSFAVDALMEAFGEKVDGWKGYSRAEKQDLLEEQGLEAPESDKKWRVGDVVMTFDDRDQQLGDGIIVEVQHKNESKDISLTTRDYIEQGYSVVWLHSDDFTDDRCTLSEVDFRHRARESAIDAVWPDILPESDQWASRKHDYQSIKSRWQETYDSGLVTAGSDAIIPTEWFDQKALEIWRGQYWYNLFARHREHFSGFAYDSQHYTHDVRESLDSGPSKDVRLPLEWYHKQSMEIWRSQDWDSIFNPGDSRNHIMQSIVPRSPTTQHSEVKLPRELQHTQKYYDSDWEDLFWDSYPPYQAQKSTIELEIDIAPFIPEGFWRHHYERTKPSSPDMGTERRDVKERVIRIIYHQTGGPQPPAIDLSHIKRVASHANYDPEHIEWAVNTLADQQSITKTDGGYQLGTATIDRGDVSF